jgi:uncharacterized membrane protein
MPNGFVLFGTEPFWMFQEFQNGPLTLITVNQMNAVAQAAMSLV